MNDATLVDIIIQTMLVTAKIVGPMLAVSLVVGFTVSLFQAVTQIQEFTLTFVPKFVGLGIVILLGGPWMLHELISYTNGLFDIIPTLIACERTEPAPVTLSIDSQVLVGFVLAMARAGAWIAIAPPFGMSFIPARVKVGLAAGLALALGPRLAEQDVPLETGPLIGAILLQVAAGAALGFLAYLLFAAFQTAGSMIDLFGAFSMSQALDPVSGVQTSVFGRFYSLIAAVLIFVTGGHLLLVRGFLTSFEALPVDGFRSERIAEVLTADLGTFFLAAIEIAAPLVAALFLTDVALGLLSRAAPEMNVFMLGLPLKVFVTISLVSLVIPVLPGVVTDVTDTAVRHGLRLGG